MPTHETVESALKNDRLIDIITLGRKTGQARRIEIWFHNVAGRIIICGKPRGERDDGTPWSNRGWLANLRANPNFTFCLKESCEADLPARAVEITDVDDRRRLMGLPQMQWYQEQVENVEDLVVGSPIVEIFFDAQ
ncbi:nitroreductase family deazaflavin-dependent oxidoreductase [Myxococcota bacterium]|nr:nitroreductase family deazaflavin-dependent oxidoreductase [Myxococcota bacterium]